MNNLFVGTVRPPEFTFGEITFTFGGLAAQCEIPPHIAQYPFEIVSQRGVSHVFALFS